MMLKPATESVSAAAEILAGLLRDQLCSTLLGADIWQRTPAASG